MHLPAGATTFRSPARVLPWPVAANQIRAVTFRPVSPGADADREGGHALFMTLDVAEPTRLTGFLEDVVTRFNG